ncbi:methyltransferase [Kribbella sp. NPDC058245]|uniref:methyltransferase n=1 Tax=Kribbella sp. NPDC058245 TaxID=3346399 RepID=UPI0036EBA6A7
MHGNDGIDLRPAQRLIDRHLAHTEPYQVEIDSLQLLMLPGVFCPTYTKTSTFLAEHTQVEPGERVLDMFCGSGYQGLMAARRGASVLCVDWSAEAVSCATTNAERNGLADRVVVRQGDLFAPVSGQFDVIIANPPLLPITPSSMFETAVYDSALAHSNRFLEEVRDYLAPGGRAYFLASSAPKDQGLFDLGAEARNCGLEVRSVADRVLPYETYTVFKLQLPVGARVARR